MIEQFLAPQNAFFAIALGLFLVLSLWIIVATLLGLGFSTPLDDFLPDIDMNLEGDVSFSAAAFSWLNLGKLPLIVSFLIWLFLFAFIGFNLQEIISSTGAPRLPIYFATPVAFVLSIYPLKWGNHLMAKVMPKDETSAISEDTFIGLVGTITLGEAKAMKPAEARVKGINGKNRHLLVVPDNDQETFAQGEEVLIVGRKGPFFSVIRVDSPGLQ